MLTDEERQRGADALLRAERELKPIPQLSRTFPGIELVDAYAIQGLWAQARVAQGARIVGHKIGLTSRAMQMASKMTEPDYGCLLDDMLWNDGAQIPAGRFLAPRLEVELAFVMGAPLAGPGARVHDVMRATEFVVPALEIIDYRTEVPRAITDTIADNAAAGGMIIGGRTIRPMDVDIRWVGATLSKNGIIEESGVSAAIMGHPAAGIAWLVNKLAALDARLEAGQIVLAGSFTRPVVGGGRRRDPCRLRPARRHRRVVRLTGETGHDQRQDDPHRPSRLPDRGVQGADDLQSLFRGCRDRCRRDADGRQGRGLPDVPAHLFRLTNIRGALVTMPHKVTTVGLLDEVTTTVKVAGSCNAILRRPDGTLLGDMFDGAGFARGVERKGRPIQGARALVVGSGGVGWPSRPRWPLAGSPASASSTPTRPQPRRWARGCRPTTRSCRSRPAPRTQPAGTSWSTRRHWA